MCSTRRFTHKLENPKNVCLFQFWCRIKCTDAHRNNSIRFIGDGHKVIKWRNFYRFIFLFLFFSITFFGQGFNTNRRRKKTNFTTFLKFCLQIAWENWILARCAMPRIERETDFSRSYIRRYEFMHVNRCAAWPRRRRRWRQRRRTNERHEKWLLRLLLRMIGFY